MKQKRIIALASALFFISMISGCAKKETPNAEAYRWNIESVPEHVTEALTDSVQIDADVRILSGFEDGKADVMHIREKEIDREKVSDVFKKGKTIEKQDVHNDKGIYDDWEDYGDIENYLFSDGSKLTIAKPYFHYQTKLSEYIVYCTRLPFGCQGMNREHYETVTEDFDFMSMDEAENICYELLTELGISVHRNAWEAFRLPHDVLRDEEEVIVMENLPPETQPSPKPEWTEDDDCYYFDFYPTINGNGMIPDTYVSGSEALRGFQPARVIYNKSGIVQAYSFDGGFEPVEVIEKDVPLMSYETLMEKFKASYKNIITDTKLTVKRIALGYVLLREKDEKQFTATPVWSMTMVYDDPLLGISSNESLFNAVTGEEIH